MRRGIVTVFLIAACKSSAPAPAVVRSATDAGVAPAVVAGALLEQAQGPVELQRKDGAWTTASRGDRIGEQDGLRTPVGGIAVVSVDGARVTLHDRSELRLTSARPGRLAARVRGRVESDVVKGKGRVSLQVDDAGAQADSEGGHFVVTAEGQTVAIAATTGSVAVSAGGKSFEVKQGEVMKVEGGLPEQPVAALQKVLLTVEWPGENTNRSSVPVAGKVEAGSRVYVQGQPVEVAPSGEFRTDVRLHDGRQRIAVVTVDPSGRREARESEVVRDSTPPAVKVTSPWR